MAEPAVTVAMAEVEVEAAAASDEGREEQRRLMGSLAATEHTSSAP